MDKASEHIILYDGTCRLCQGLTGYIAQRDTGGVFNFIPLQSKPGQNLLKKYAIQESGIDSFVYIRLGKAFLKSSAAIRVFNDMGWPWKLLNVGWIVPRFARDLLYQFIANHRYRIWGKTKVCALPDLNFNLDEPIEK